MAKYCSTKNYGNDRGFSTAFRQWRSTHSHCQRLHGYSVGIRVVFESETLDDRNWVFDFGGMKAFEAWAKHMFDHTTVVAISDPSLEDFKQLDKKGLIDIRVIEEVGCEKFAELAYNTMSMILYRFQKGESWSLKGKFNDELATFKPAYPVGQGVKVRSVEVYEHAGNSAIYEG